METSERRQTQADTLNSNMLDLPPGVVLHRGYLDRVAQQDLALEIAEVIARAPLYSCAMPRTGAPMSVRMTNCGDLGWLSDKEGGYRYVPCHPVTDEAWPAIPKALLLAWERLAGYPEPPEACLINVYDAKARMGVHQDRDEKDFTAPVVSLSLGADCRFRVGGTRRSGKTTSLVLSSGDALVLGGPARLCFHGVDRVFPTLLAPLAPSLPAGAARVNLTLRRVS
jgi:alkylated DNA repair protein (DNA oxidative demethylase)